MVSSENLASPEPLLPKIREAIHADKMVYSGPASPDIVDDITSSLDQQSPIHAFDESLQQKTITTSARVIRAFQKKVDASLFVSSTERAQLTNELAGDVTDIMAAGWCGNLALKLAIHHPPETVLDLRQSYLSEPIWSERTLMRYIAHSARDPQTTLDLVIRAFTWTRQQERILAPSNRALHKALSLPTLREGDLAIKPGEQEFPSLPPDDPHKALDLIRNTAVPRTGHPMRSSGNPSLRAYLQRVIAASPEVTFADVVNDISSDDCHDFLNLVAWYADVTGYEAVNTPSFIEELTTCYITDVATIQQLGINKADALQHARHHGSSYYENILDQVEALGMPVDAYITYCLRANPIDAQERLSKLSPVYAKTAILLPDLRPSKQLLFALRYRHSKDLRREAERFQQRITAATALFGTQLPIGTIQTVCLNEPRLYMQHLRTKRHNKRIK